MSASAKVLVVGSGGREHALALALLESPSVAEVCVLPGNGGTQGSDRASELGKILRNVTGSPVDEARQVRADLVVVGPEAPLCAGLVDELERQGVPTYGPTQKAAELEGSKAFMKSFALRHGIRTARHVVLADARDIAGVVSEFAEPPVVKADGLCAGKGVVVAESHAEAIDAARGMLEGARFGVAGATVVHTCA